MSSSRTKFEKIVDIAADLVPDLLVYSVSACLVAMGLRLSEHLSTKSTLDEANAIKNMMGIILIFLSFYSGTHLVANIGKQKALQNECQRPMTRSWRSKLASVFAFSGLAMFAAMLTSWILDNERGVVVTSVGSPLLIDIATLLLKDEVRTILEPQRHSQAYARALMAEQRALRVYRYARAARHEASIAKAALQRNQEEAHQALQEAIQQAEEKAAHYNETLQQSFQIAMRNVVAKTNENEEQKTALQRSQGDAKTIKRMLKEARATNQTLHTQHRQHLNELFTQHSHIMHALENSTYHTSDSRRFESLSTQHRFFNLAKTSEQNNFSLPDADEFKYEMDISIRTISSH